MLENFKETVNVPGGLGFIFDIVIAQINLTNINIEDISKLKVDVKFINNNIQITSSRINVTEFKAGVGLEFNERPSKVKDQLFRNPIECQVYYDNQDMGTCTFILPDSFINCIAGDCGRELMHCGEADIKKDNQKVGRMEIIARLKIKCHEFELKKIIQSKADTCNPADNVINPNDVLFVVGEDKKASVVCSDIDVIPASESGSSANATCLDLSGFRHINGKTVANTDILDSIDAKCCKLKKSSNHCKRMMDHLLELKKPKETLGDMKHKSQQQSLQLSCDQETKPVNCISDSRFASCSSSDSYNPCQCISDENESNTMICQNDNLIEKPTKRYCPLCHENVSWLPKFAACPKCGYRPIPYDIEKPYDFKLTAEQILQEFTNKKEENDYQSDRSAIVYQQKPQCRCTCKDGKICAHCRIKKLCEDIFQPPKKDEGNCGKCEAKSSDLYNVCKTSSRDCRPYLMKVFEELRDIYDLKETKKKQKDVENFHSSHCLDKEIEKEEKQNRKMEKATSRPQSDKKKLEQERKKFLVNSFQRNESCKGKIFDYNNQRKYPGTKIGHKTCLNGFGGRRNVPRNMGWLWNAETKGLRTGWQPGAIRKSIKVLMQHFLNVKHPCCDLQLNEGSEKNENNDEEEDYTKEPTLYICKKNGDYYITLRPLNNIGNHCANMKPIQFKITKNPLLIEMRKLKEYLKSLGFAKCVCHQPISSCSCRSFLEKKKLEYQCCKESHKRELPNCCNTLILSDTSDSEAEFEFGVTPPAGVAQPDRCLKKRRRKVSTATQYEDDDWKINEEYPKPLTKYFKLHNCAVGQRFGKAFGPYGIKGYIPGATPVEGIYGPCGLIPGAIDGMRAKGGKGKALKGAAAFIGPDGKFNLAQYLAFKELNKPSPEEIAERKRQRMALLKGGNPPLLCKVDRRGKPIDVCDTCVPICCYNKFLRDNRIC